MNRIEHYDNYRDFLKDYFEEKKRTSSFFSSRYFCRKAGLSSPSLYQEVVEGRRNLTQRTIPAFVKGLGLTDKDAAFFNTLVHYNQSKTQQEAELYLEQLRKLREKVKAQIVSQDHHDYYSKWYHTALRELACLIDWKDDYEKLAQSLNPPITQKEAKESVELLLKLEFIVKKKDKYYQSSPAITTGTEAMSSSIRSVNKQFCELGMRALDVFARDERCISNMTIGISRQAYEQIVQEAGEFNDRVRSIVNNDKESETVYNINFQMFPLTKKQD
ncbi:MAG: TIGR02147 family protein [Chitinispirillia bacterium]|nr:TIGR02147 family protein [Chitinispirillia bacterium]